MKKIFFSICLMFITAYNYAQAPDWQWAKSAVGTSDDRAYSVAVDVSGNAYVAGRFDSDTLNFGITTLTNAGIGDIFLAKYDASGNVLWAKSAGGTKYDFTRSIAVDSIGNVYLTGYFYSSIINFDTIVLTKSDTNNTSDIFLSKYDASGNVLWAKVLGGVNYDEANSVAADASGNIYLSGCFSESFINIDSITLTNDSTGLYDIFIAKYNTDGNVLWAKSINGKDNDESYSVTVDASGNSFIVGSYFSSILSFDSTIISNVHAPYGDIFLAKYDTYGNVLWAKSAVGTENDFANSVAVDASGDSYVAGFFDSPTLTFDPITLINLDYRNLFIAKYDANGNVLWAKSTGGPHWDYAYSVAADSSGNAYLSGSFDSPSITFGTNILTNYTTIGTGDLFLVKYNSNGNVLWAKSAGGTNYDVSYSVAVDASGNIYTAGWFNSPILAFGSNTLMTAGTVAIFLAKVASDTITGINESIDPLSISIFPNPSIDNINIIITQKATIEMLNIEGQIIKTLQSNGNIETIDVENLSSGIYILRVMTDREIVTTKFIKQ
jgi:hypothetical protein